MKKHTYSRFAATWEPLIVYHYAEKLCVSSSEEDNLREYRRIQFLCSGAQPDYGKNFRIGIGIIRVPLLCCPNLS